MTRNVATARIRNIAKTANGIATTEIIDVNTTAKMEGIGKNVAEQVITTGGTIKMEGIAQDPTTSKGDSKTLVLTVSEIVNMTMIANTVRKRGANVKGRRSTGTKNATVSMNGKRSSLTGGRRTHQLPLDFPELLPTLLPRTPLSDMVVVASHAQSHLTKLVLPHVPLPHINILLRWLLVPFPRTKQPR